jgi:hypothetical protein
MAGEPNGLRGIFQTGQPSGNSIAAMNGKIEGFINQYQCVHLKVKAIR